MLDGAAFISICFFVTCGAGFAVFLLAFNLRYRSLRFVKMTSPNINVIIILASLGLYACCVLLIMEPTVAFTETSATALYQMRVWLLSSSITAYVAAMFAKGWRVSKLFQYSSIQRIVIKDSVLFGIIAGLVAANGVLLSVWYIVDPLECSTRTNDTPSSLLNETRWPAMRVDYSGLSCQSFYYYAWMSALFLYDLGVACSCLVVGWKIRHIRSPSLDDSQCILFTANSSLMILAAATWLDRSLATVDQAAAIVYSVALWWGTTLSLCFNFATKVHAVLKNSGKEPVQHGFSKYLSSDLAAERALAQTTAKVSTILTGREDGVNPNVSAGHIQSCADLSSSRDSGDSRHDPTEPTRAEKFGSLADKRDERSSDGRCSCDLLSHISCLSDITLLRSRRKSSAKRRSSSARFPVSGFPNSERRHSDASRVPFDDTGHQVAQSPRNAFGRPSFSYQTADPRNEELILSIATTYNLPDDADTYSYISSWIPSAYYVQHPRCSLPHQQATIDSDQLYPTGSRLDRIYHVRRKRKEVRPKSSSSSDSQTSPGNSVGHGEIVV